MDNQSAAAGGEDLAAQFYESAGWTVAARNWSCDIGELDLVVRRTVEFGGKSVIQVAFVEVKTRIVSKGPRPEVRVGAAKRRRLATVAALFMAKAQIRGLARFDVVGIDLDTGEVRHYPSAFDAVGRLR